MDKQISKPKLIRITTVPESLGLFLGQPKYMNSFFEVICISSPGNMVEETRLIEGVKVITVPMTRIISPYSDLISVYKLFKILRREKPLIVHTHTPKAGTLGMIASALARVPHRLHTVAGMPLLVAKGRRRKLLEIVEKITYACATRIYPNSFGIKNFIIKENFTNPSKVKVFGNGSSNGIDTSFFSSAEVTFEQKDALRKNLGILNDDFVFLFVGRLVKDKGINELINAFKKLCQEQKNIKMILAGYFENELDPILPETKLEIENNPNILAVGFQRDIRAYFAISDVLTFPSYREGFPNVVMQAGAMGLPSIVTDINGCNEIIIEGKNGTIIPIMDSKALEDKMRIMLEQPAYKEKLASGARQLIVDRYERKALWDEILKEYKSLVKDV